MTPVDHKAANAKLKGIMDSDPTADLIKNLPKVQKPSFVKHTEKMRKEISTAQHLTKNDDLSGVIDSQDFKTQDI